MVQDAGDRIAAGPLGALAPRSWAPNVFGVVNAERIRRRPTDVVRVVLATVVVGVSAVAAHTYSGWQERTFDLLDTIPSWLRSSFEALFHLGTIGAVLVVLIALLLTRRFTVAFHVIGAGALAWALAVALKDVVDTASVRSQVHGAAPVYPVVTLAISTAALLVVVPFLVRPARRLVLAAFVIGAVCAGLSVVGLPLDLIGSLALGWGVAALVHLAFGTPAATPSLAQVARDLEALGVRVDGLRLAPAQSWGETRYAASAPDGTPISIDVIGRDAADARLSAKVVRWVVYRDSGPTLAITRPQELEHRAYVLLLAQRAGVPVSDVVIAGMAGPHADALLVMSDPEGVPLAALPPGRCNDAVLDDAWTNVTRLRDARLTHGRLMAANILVRDDDTTAFVDFASGSAAAPPQRCAHDAVELLAATAAVVGVERALAAAQRSIGSEGIATLLPLLQSGALSPASRRALPERKKLLADLRREGAALVGEDEPKLTELRRVKPGDIVMAAATVLGFYLIINQFAGIDLGETLQSADWVWVVVAAVLSPLPQFTGAIALQGAVDAPLPYGPVLGEQFANNFTGLIGGTMATTALVIRFFQKQGQTVAVAASSGVLNSLAGFSMQVLLVTIGVVMFGGDFSLGDSGGSSSSGRILILAIIVAGVAVTLAMLVPKLRARVKSIVAPQLDSAKDNLRGILSTPRKAVMLFGGNLLSQLIFAAVLDASLHAYGGSLPYMQIVLINSLASFIGGMAPVPGGMGIIEAGMIGGLTAAGVPQDVAVAATFTHRLFTAYLPPIWGWFALQWLRRNDYV